MREDAEEPGAVPVGMHNLRAAALVFLAIVAAEHAHAQPAITTVPANPTEKQSFAVVLPPAGGCNFYLPATVNGANIDVRFTLGFPECPGPQPFTFTIGPLPPGTYTIRVIDGGNTVVASGSVTVTAVVPALGGGALSALAAALTAAAVLTLRGRAA